VVIGEKKFLRRRTANRGRKHKTEKRERLGKNEEKNGDPNIREKLSRQRGKSGMTPRSPTSKKKKAPTREREKKGTREQKKG